MLNRGNKKNPIFASLIKNKYIRKFLGTWLLAIFVLSNTPIKVLHFFFANHADVHLIVAAGNEPQLQPAGIDCHCDSNVVITPYLYGMPVQMTAPVFLATGHIIVANEQVAFTSYIYFEHRGPPAIV